MSKTIQYIILALLVIGVAAVVFGGRDSLAPVTDDERVDIYSTTTETTTATTSATSAAPSSVSFNSKPKPQTMFTAIMHTNKGDITIEFLPSQAPNTVTNFLKLSKEGFYDEVKFHRVIKGFMIQGGDPLSKDDTMIGSWGTGGPGYKFNDEITPDNHNNIGTLSMANAGPNTNGSQFFINTANNNFLDSKHTVFAKVTSGMSIVTAIESTQTGVNDRPVDAVVITSIEVK